MREIRLWRPAGALFTNLIAGKAQDERVDGHTFIEHARLKERECAPESTLPPQRVSDIASPDE
jgi:hypothetical protein